MKPPMILVTDGAEMNYSQKMPGSDWQNSGSTVGKSKCLSCSAGEIIKASASQPLSKSHASHGWSLAQIPGFSPSPCGEQHWGKAALSAQHASPPHCLHCIQAHMWKIKKTEGREKKGPPPTKALRDTTFRRLRSEIIKDL